MKCGLLGRRLGHSYSPLIHSKLGDYSYGLFEKEPEELEDFLRSGDFDGLNVTIPYKKAVIPFLDSMDDAARLLGNVNTIVRRPDGHLEGHNTDFDGFSHLLRASGLEVAGKKALVLGSGGASQTVQAVLRQAEAQVFCISRTGPHSYANLSQHRDAALIVNATPVGMYPDTGTAPVDVWQFPRLEGVLDLIYNPARTRLMLDCEKRGIPCQNGLSMLVAQAKQAAQWFQGCEIPSERIPEIQRELEIQMQNLVLIGMAGCGKTTVGQLLAQKTGRRFVDSDAEIEKLAHKSIPEIFEQDGEEEFRRLETQVLSRLGKQSGLVLATGGGCVTRPENYPLLHQNGVLIWLRRAPELLAADGRPLSQKTDPRLLYEQRLPLYQSMQDIIVENCGTPEQTCQRLLQAIREEFI